MAQRAIPAIVEKQACFEVQSAVPYNVPGEGHYFQIDGVPAPPVEAGEFWKEVISLLTESPNPGAPCPLVHHYRSLIGTLAHLLHAIGGYKTAVVLKNEHRESRATWIRQLPPAPVTDAFFRVYKKGEQPSDEDFIFYFDYGLHHACCAKTLRDGRQWHQFGFYNTDNAGDYAAELPSVAVGHCAEWGGRWHNGRCLALHILFALEAARSRVTDRLLPPTLVNPDLSNLLVFFGLYRAALANKPILAERRDGNAAQVRHDFVNLGGSTTFFVKGPGGYRSADLAPDCITMRAFVDTCTPV